MNWCNAVRIMTMSGCNAIRSMTMNDCNSLRSIKMHGCNGARSMKMHGCSGVKSMTRVITKGHYEEILEVGIKEKVEIGVWNRGTRLIESVWQPLRAQRVDDHGSTDSVCAFPGIA